MKEICVPCNSVTCLSFAPSFLWWGSRLCALYGVGHSSKGQCGSSNSNNSDSFQAYAALHRKVKLREFLWCLQITDRLFGTRLSLADMAPAWEDASWTETWTLSCGARYCMRLLTATGHNAPPASRPSASGSAAPGPWTSLEPDHRCHRISIWSTSDIEASES